MRTYADVCTMGEDDKILQLSIEVHFKEKNEQYEKVKDLMERMKDLIVGNDTEINYMLDAIVSILELMN